MKIAILGAGKLGTRITEALQDSDYDITLADINEDKLDQVAQQYDVMTVCGDARTVELLEQIDVKHTDYLISVTASDDANILAASFAKALGCGFAAARVRDPGHMNQIDFIRDTMDIDMIVNPDLLITDEIYRYLIEKYTLSNGVYTFSRIALIEFDADKKPEIIGKTLTEFRGIMPEFLMIGLSRNGRMIIPHGNDVVEHGDIVYLIGEKEDVLNLEKTVRGRKHRSQSRRVMIIGGGKTGYYLSRRLAEYGSKVKLFEKDPERCVYLTNKLRNVMVLNSDGTDVSLLEEEDMDKMDAFVTCTGYDEENLMLALTAKNHGIEDVISKISHNSYKDLIDSLGIDMILNPVDITSGSILRAISGSKHVLSSVLLQGQAELMEIYASEGMSMLNVPLSDLHLPHQIIIAAIHRGMETIIPDGKTVIRDGDKVMVVCLLSHIGHAEKLMRPGMRFNMMK